MMTSTHKLPVKTRPADSSDPFRPAFCAATFATLKAIPVAIAVQARTVDHAVLSSLRGMRYDEECVSIGNIVSL